MDPNANLHPVGCESSPTESEGTLVEFQDALMEMPQSSLMTPLVNLQTPQSNPTTAQLNLKLPQSNPNMPQSSLKTPLLNLQIPQSNPTTAQLNLKLPQSNPNMPQSSLQTPLLDLQVPQSNPTTAQLNPNMPQSKTLAGIRRDVENFYCGKCSLWLNDLNALEHHIRTSSVHKPSTEKLPFTCAICMGRFPTGETLKAHIEYPPWNSVMHATWEEASYAAEYDAEWQWERIAMQQGGIFCYPCNRLFMSQDSLNQHLASSTAHKIYPRVN
ncbi:hypothetical protein N7513_011618 [Penicillium frequentans]|nr:hypothetical protein N7513_011618 [Penicillium glabrum]